MTDPGQTLKHLIKRTIKQAVDRAIAPFDVQLVSKRAHDWSDVSNFVPFTDTIEAAKRAGMSVGDYIDSVMNNIPGASQGTIDKMSSLGVFSGRIQSVLEIGPGSGRYLEKTLKACRPTRYEIYETAAAWADYVSQQYGVIRQRTDGRSLAATATSSIDLAQAHKLFSTIPFIATCRYWLEMARVTKGGGYVVFDIVTDECLDRDAVELWAASGIANGSSYPAAMPRAVAKVFFESRGFSLVGSFFVPMPPGRTETFVYRKTGA